MDQTYAPIYKQAVNLQNQFRDWLDDSNQPAARSLTNDIQRLVDEIESSKNPHSLEDRIRQIQRQLQDVQRQTPPCIGHGHSESLCDSFEQVRMSLRQLPNY